jgi:hypothetical protein
MVFHVAVICDAATEHAGKLNILGAFDSIAGVRFPLVHPHCAIALRMRFGPMEEGPHEIRIVLIDGDGREALKPMEMKINVRILKDGYFASHNAVINLERLPFRTPGEYAFDISVDGEPRTSIPLKVMQVKRPQTPGGNAQQ